MNFTTFADKLLKIANGTRKIVINKSYGGFGLSQEALEKMHELGSKYVSFNPKSDKSDEEDIPTKEYEIDHNIPRDDSNLIHVVESLGSKADGPHAELKIVHIPNDVRFEIAEYNGKEHIAEQHRKWH